MKELKNVKCFGGLLKTISHESSSTKCEMKFCIYVPNVGEKVPVIYYLAGLTCNEEVGMIKSGILQYAAQHKMAIVAPDTSPRGLDIEGEEDSWDFGTGAGFYVDATESKFSPHYNMYTYVTQELPKLVNTHYPILETKMSIMGHSMGGHGALVIGLRNPELYVSISAFAPICHPSECPWGIKAFTGYLGPGVQNWQDYDATLFMRNAGPFPNLSILIDQGTEDNFYHEKQLLPEAFQSACQQVNQPNVHINMQDGYDHSYYFITSFMQQHMDFHAKALA